MESTIAARMTNVARRPEQKSPIGYELGRDIQQVRREIAAVLLLASVAVVVFVVTRELAAWERRLGLADASRWYSEGSARLADGHLDQAVAALRRAHTKNPASQAYAIAFAHALSASGRYDDATRVLTSLREGSPEDPQINLELARLAAAHDDAEDATRYFRSALYGVWPDGQGTDRRAARVEFVRFLLRHNERTAAVAELVALTANLADTVAEHTDAGRLMLDADEPQRALEQFRRGLALVPADKAALAGAGEASFTLGDYAGARRYLLQVREPSPKQIEERDLATQVLERDPLAPKLPFSERRRRLIALFEGQVTRIDSCRTLSRDASAAHTDQLDSLQRELVTIEDRLHRGVQFDSGEFVDTAFASVIRAYRATTENCGLSATDKALGLIGRAHEGRV